MSFAMRSRSISDARCSSRSKIFSIAGRKTSVSVTTIARSGPDSPLRSSRLGRSTSNLLGRRLSTASSRSNGRLVAPITTTRLSRFAPAELRPSISCMNSVRSWSWALLPNPPPRADRAPKSASTSSRKTTQGDKRRAREKTALTLCKVGQQRSPLLLTYSFSPSPKYLSFTSLGCRGQLHEDRSGSPAQLTSSHHSHWPLPELIGSCPFQEVQTAARRWWSGP